MKDTRRRMELYSFYDHTGIAAHLEKLAAEGWRLEKVGSFLWTYRRSEPKQVKYAVSYFPKASEFDPEPTEEQRTFQDFCARTGWEFVCSTAQLQIFVNERPDPTPIETDPALEVDTLHRAAKKSFLPVHFILLGLGALNLALRLVLLFTDPVRELSSDLSLFSVLCWLVVVALTGVELISYFRWHGKAARAAEQGEFLPTRSRVGFQLAMLAILIVGVVYLLCSMALRSGAGMAVLLLISFAVMFLLIALVQGVKKLLKRLKVSRKVNRALTFTASFVLSFALTGGIVWGTMAVARSGVFDKPDEDVPTYEYHGHTFPAPYDELPLTVEDLLDVSYDGYIREHTGSGSLLLAQYTGYQHPRFGADHYADIPTLNYTVTQVKAPFLYPLARDALMGKMQDYVREDGTVELANHYVPADPAPWGASAAYQREYGGELWWDTWLLCYDGRMVEIVFSWPPTPAQMALVGEKLGK